MQLKNLPPLEMTSGATFGDETLQGKWTVLYFYPKDATPGCTLEGQQFRDNIDEFKGLGVQILGVSRDKLTSHERFKERQSFPFELVSDPEEKLCTLFDVIKEKKLYGKTYMGIERSTFIINPELVVVAEWRKVKVKAHDAEVLDRLKTLIS